jgi:hypothetical protein
MFETAHRAKILIIASWIALFGIIGIALAIIITPTFATSYLSPDNNNRPVD